MKTSVGPAFDLAPSLVSALTLERQPYVLGEPLAQGGMAALFHGQRIAHGGFVKRVVLKRLRPELRDNREAEALFLREACLGAELEHPAIVRVHDLTQIDGITYLVMEYVHGGDLRLVLRRLRRRGRRLAVAAALYLGRELCTALEYAHSLARPDGSLLGLIHRDVSPTNILLSVDGEVKLGDFGIAHTDPTTDQSLSARARGQIGYMSPEQARGEALDGRSDLFSLATVLYEVCTGQRLYVGEVGQSAVEVYATQVVPPSRLDSGLPPALDLVLLRALALTPEERQPSAARLYDDLLHITRSCQLWMDRRSFAEHLLEVCGPSPADWSTVEERTNTALIASELEDALSLAGSGDAEAPRGEDLSAAMVHGVPTIGADPGDEPSESLITVPWPVVRGVDLPPSALTERYPRQEPLPGEETQPLAKLSGPRQVAFQTGLFRLPTARRLLRRDRLVGVLVGLLLSALLWLIMSLSS